jgi:hypothetical protein
VSSDWTPLRWPSEWSHPSALDLVSNSPVNFLLLQEKSPLISQMQQRGLATLEGSNAPPGVTIVKGEWPGVRAPQGGGSAGPTGVPWVDSNGWQVRLARLRKSENAIWVQTTTPRRVIGAAAYLLAIADAAMYGARWIIEPDADLSRDVAAGKLDTWNRMMSAARFFAAHKEWNDYRAQGVVGIYSDFQGANEFTGGELANLTARQNQPYRILTGPESWKGLKAILYANAEPPSAATKKVLIEFANSGGLVITGGTWAAAEGTAAGSHQRYSIRGVGKGRIASGDLTDPYQAAADAQILLSHRHDLVRFWNGGSLGSYLTAPPSGKGALLQIVNYSGRPGNDPVSVRIAGPYREARIRQLEDAEPKPLDAIHQKEAIELHLPAIPVYAAIELI